MLTRFCYLIVCVTLVTGATLPFEGSLEDGTIISPHIVGGSSTDCVVYPHQVTLRYKPINCPECAFEHRCGGSIYDEVTIITAAHCVIATVASQFQVVAGTNYRRGSDGVIVPVKEIIRHERYNAQTYDSDIAILTLRTPLPLNNFTINKIELADEEPIEGTISTITGWGDLAYRGNASEVLQAVNVPIVGHASCDKDHGGNRISKAMLCAGVRGIGGRDACNGDSGGPLIANGKLTGVVSWGYQCADPRYPGVYANIPYLLPWILEKIALEKLKG